MRSAYSRAQQRALVAVEHLDALADRPAEARDGHRVRLTANAGLLSDLRLVERHGAEGIGLFRTELLALVHRGFPTEEEQEKLYEQVAAAMKPRPVTIRTLDLGGDKATGTVPRQPRPQTSPHPRRPQLPPLGLDRPRLPPLPPRALDTTPLLRWQNDIEQVRQLPPATDLRRLFFHRLDRLVRRDCTFLLQKHFYEAPPHLAGHTVEGRFDPLDPSQVEIYFQGQPQGSALIVDPIVNAQLPSSKPMQSPEPQSTGINYVELLNRKKE